MKIYTKKGPKNPARIVTKSYITTKHRMFRRKIYTIPENFRHPPDVMDVTFRMSALNKPGRRQGLLYKQHRDSFIHLVSE